MNFVTLIFTTLLLTSCASSYLETQTDPAWGLPNIKEYKKTIKAHTINKKSYVGFYNQFDLKITKLNQDILTKQLKMNANFMQWTPEVANEERAKILETMSKESLFFVSSYTPQRDLNVLEIASLGWTATLEYNGKKITGQFRPDPTQAYRLQVYYPHHTIWSKSYILSFPIPTAETENTPQTIVLTSPYGYAKFHYNN